MEMALASSLSMTILASGLFLIAFLILQRIAVLNVSRKLPPGNICLPLIGETFFFLKRHPATSVGEFTEHRMTRFGKIFSSHLFGKRSIVCADPEFNQFVLKNEVKLFQHSLPPSFEKLVGKHSILLMDGDVHKHMRSTVLDFLCVERLRTVFLSDADRLASEIVNSWNEKDVISAIQEATKFSLNIMVKKLLSMNPGDPEVERLSIEYNSLTRAFSCFPVYIPGTTYWKAMQSRNHIIKIFKQEMEARMRGGGCRNAGNEEDDFLGWLMKNTDYSQEKISDFLLGQLFAGHKTISQAISLLIYFLQTCPKAVSELREEHLQVVRSNQHLGDSKLSWDDFKRMEFTRCVINETLRLGNIVRFAMKKASKSFEYKDYVIPKGSTVLLHYAAGHLDPCQYADPEHFNPWRWQLQPGIIKVPDSFMPFSKGIRMCPGAELARLEMTVFLHHLILKFDWQMAEDDHPVATPILEFPKGLPIKIRAVSNGF
uniref:Cytochrome P450 n=1 Tax=Chlorophytum borivilianum TaxID=503355 RepID=A0A097PA02_9ASPA|nr:cytochrome P450 [Chlorophytum borivilianum]